MELFAQRDRATVGLLCLLLFLVLGFLAYTFIDTVYAVRSFQQQYHEVKIHDVSAIRPWMTIHAISHFYHVPEDYLYNSLQMGNSVVLRHETLYEIASHKKQHVAQVVDTIQDAIIVYRKAHPLPVTPTPKPHGKTQPRSPTPGRTNT